MTDSAPCKETGAHPGMQMSEDGTWRCTACGWAVTASHSPLPEAAPNPDTVERCPDCGREKAETPTEGFGRCKAHLPSLLAPSKCATLTVTRLKAELSTAQELIDATLRWRDYDETHDPKSPGWTTAPIVGFFQAVERYRRAKKGTE